MPTRTSSAAASSASSPFTSSSSSDASDAISTDLLPGESCEYIVGRIPVGDLWCREPRTCYSCLQKTGCMINQFGQCVSQLIDGYNPTMNYRVAYERGVAVSNTTDPASPAQQYEQEWHFPAIETTYCAVSDDECTQCVGANFYRESGWFPDSRFCVGRGGCVCIDNCERPWLVSKDCSGPVTAEPISAQDSGVLGPQFTLGVAILMIPIFVVGIVSSRRWRRQASLERQREQLRQAQVETRREPRPSSLGVNPLQLSGWQAHRSELVAKEHRRLAGAEDVDTTAVPEVAYVEVQDGALGTGSRSRTILPEARQQLTAL